MRLQVAHDFLPKVCTVRASRVMDHFGIDFEQGRHVIADGLELPIQPGQVVLFTGPSGSGKSSLMRAAAQQLVIDGTAPPRADNQHGDRPAVLDINGLHLGGELLIDALPLEAIEAMQLLAQCGLGEARLLLRRPSELSDGQQYRLRLALAIAQQPAWLLADEFTATLDRTLARVIAFNLRRLCDRVGVGFLLATTHEDVVDDLSPDVHVRCGLDGSIDVIARGPASVTAIPADSETPACKREKKPGFLESRKKKESASNRISGSARRPVATGRISLGGITAAMSSR